MKYCFYKQTIYIILKLSLLKLMVNLLEILLEKIILMENFKIFHFIELKPYGNP